ncbi:MAG: hypothetical protein HQL18_00570 [Candidatus Omnitrophica bacterium]|nr:hypothetical protein [Candidatus Omnitrophota bacterium]
MPKEKFPFVALAFILCLAYWTYLFFATQIVIVWDADHYISIAKIILNQGWETFFKTGPQREPGYPWLISVSLSLEKTTHLRFEDIQKILQLFMLFLCQAGVMGILRSIKIREIVIALTILYMGISPALLNASLSLFSEIATLPAIVAVILITSRYFAKILSNRPPGFLQSTAFGLLLGLAFFALTAVKGTFELIGPLFLICLLSPTIFIWRKLNKRSALQAALFLIIAGFSLTSLTVAYKWKNFSSNGEYSFTNRGSYHFYGAALDRIQQKTSQEWQLALALADIQGAEAFPSFTSAKSKSTDALLLPGLERIRQLQNNGLSKTAVAQQLYKEGAQRLLKDPGQYFVLTFLMSLRALFWETFHMGFVAYPGWLQILCENSTLDIWISTLCCFLTVSALIFAGIWLLRSRREKDQTLVLTKTIPIYSAFCLITLCIETNALGWIFKRMLVPAIPLFLILIAFLAENILQWIAKRRVKILREQPGRIA